MSYASIAQYFDYGLRAAAHLQQARTLEVVDPASDSIAVSMHGIPTARRVRIVLGLNATAPGGLSALSDYYAIAVSEDVMRLASSPSNALAGIPVDITSPGSGALGLKASILDIVQGQLDQDSATIDGALKCYGTPLLAPIPLEVVKVNCHLSAFNVATTLGMLNPAQPTQDIENVKARHDFAQKTLERWRAGENLPGPPVDSTPGTTEEPAFGWGDPVRCWSPGGII